MALNGVFDFDFGRPAFFNISFSGALFTCILRIHQASFELIQKVEAPNFLLKELRAGN